MRIKDMAMIKKLAFAITFIVAALPAFPQGTTKPKATLNAEVSSTFPHQNTWTNTAGISRTMMNHLIASSQQAPQVNAQSGTNYTFLASDYGKVVTFNNVSAVAGTLPQAIGSFNPWNVNVVNSGAGTVTITPQGGSTIGGNTTLVLLTNQSAYIVSDGVNYQVAINTGNAGLSQMPPLTFKGNNNTSAAAPIDLTVAQAKSLLTVSVAVTDPAFGAKCDGSTHDEVAIQAAINSLPNDGGIVLFPNAQNCVIGATLTIGNGTTSAVSTKRGMVLMGSGNPLSAAGLPFFNGFPSPAGPKITWAGGTSSNMIQVNGPLQGYGIQNLILDCASSTGTNGILATSAAFGDNRNLVVLNCGGSGIASTTNPLGGYTGVGNVDANGTSWTNISILVPPVTGAKGFLCNGDPGGTSDTDYNSITNMIIPTPTAAANFRFFISTCDGNEFRNIRASGFTGAGVGMQLDYTANANFPNSNNFYSYEIGGNPNLVNGGTPSANVLLSKNKFYGLIESNLALAPAVAGTLATDGAWPNYTPAISCGTATFTVNSAHAKQPGSKTTYTELDFTITALGSCTSQFTFNLPFTSGSGGGFIGRELVNSFVGVVCSISGIAQTTASCVKTNAGNFALSDHVVLGGSYESQN